MLPKSIVVGRYAEELIEKLDSEKANVKESSIALDYWDT